MPYLGRVSTMIWGLLSVKSVSSVVENNLGVLRTSLLILESPLIWGDGNMEKVREVRKGAFFR